MGDKDIIQPILPEEQEQETTTPDLSPEQEDLTTLQTDVETQQLKENIDLVDADPDRAYEIMKWSKMHEKLLTILWDEAKVETFALDIDKVVRKYLDQELSWLSNSIKNSMNVAIQFAMMETLVQQWADGSAQFFEAFSTTNSSSARTSFEWLYNSFGKFGAANKFFVLANKVQNMTRYMADHKQQLAKNLNIPQLMNPLQCKKLLDSPVRSNQIQLKNLDISSILTLDSQNTLDIHAGEDELKNIVNSDMMEWVITEKTIWSIQKALKSADKLLDTRGKFSDTATQLVDKIASFLNIQLPFFGNLGELADIDFPTKMLWKKKDWWLLNFVLGVIWFRWGISWLHKKYIQEKLDEMDIDNTFVSSAFQYFKKNSDISLTNDMDWSTRKTCALVAPDIDQETIMKQKIPADYQWLKQSIIASLSSSTLSPLVVQTFAPHAITDQNTVDVSKITETDIDTYLKNIIPQLADPKKDFIQSDKVDQDWFALAVIGSLVGEKYFVEAVNIGIISPNDFVSSSIDSSQTPSNTIESQTIDYEWISIKAFADTGLNANVCKLSASDYQAFVQKVVDIAKELQINPEYLMKVMAFETWATFDTSLVNKAGSWATWLIQFMASTANTLGTSTAELSKMTPLQQLDYVKKYFLPYAGKLKTLEDTYFAVFTPEFMWKSLDTVGYTSPSIEYTQNAGLDINKDGKLTLREISETVRKNTDAYTFFTLQAATPNLTSQIETVDHETYKENTVFVGDSLSVGYAHNLWYRSLWTDMWWKTTDRMNTNFNTVLTANPKPKTVVVLWWTNDLVAYSVTKAYYEAPNAAEKISDAIIKNLQAMSDKADAAWVQFMVWTILPFGRFIDDPHTAGFGDATKKLFTSHKDIIEKALHLVNDKIKKRWPGRYIDFYKEINDPNKDGYIQAKYDGDGVHPWGWYQKMQEIAFSTRQKTNSSPLA